MPVEAKPLFRPDVLRSHLSTFQMPPIDRSKLTHWANEISSGRVDRFGEQEILPHFLNDFFVGLLGYSGPAGRERYTIGFERYVEAEGEYADAVLGEFNGHQRYVVAVEGKGPRDPLERPYGGRRISAVEQGYRYAINLPCDWIIVTSMRQTRLYHKGADQQTYERFDTEQLASSEAALRRFIFLLHADRVAPLGGKCHFYSLLEESEQVGRELTKDFYINYAGMRQDAFELLCRDNPAVPRSEVLAGTQKLLDRVLFIAFCEDRGLLPTETIRKAYEHRDPYHPRPVWHNFRGLFNSINRGNAALGIHAYNGGLFADDPVLDSLTVSDAVCQHFRELGEYDYRPPGEASGETQIVDVEILGHIFEQSITDLERIRNELSGQAEPISPEKHKSRRKKEGAFYTPAFITRYIIDQALGGVLGERFERLRAIQHESAKGAARTALVDPRVYRLEELTKAARSALVRFWEAWQDELATVRLLDPACGSGAFLIEAFDQLHAAYERSNDRLAELRGHRTLFDLDKRILENNLYGVDLNEEAIEICRLSLWIKTAERGKALTSLDHPIRVGNSVIADTTIHPKAIDWQATFPEVFSQGGFDVVIGNPPYVRQELLSELKPYLQASYAAYHGMADLYVYFYELGLKLLKPGGLLSYIVTNKWMKAGYGEPLRQLFVNKAWIRSVVDFGHAKQIFQDADVFPSILVAEAPKPNTNEKPVAARLCTIPRDQLRIHDLSRQIETEGVELPLSQLGASAWQLEPREVTSLMEKIRRVGQPLSDFAGTEPLRGILTGLNEAFLINDYTKNRLVQDDPNCESLIRRNLRGQDFGRWKSEWAGYWLICIPSSENREWPWSNSPDEEAELRFSRLYPSIAAHFAPFRERLRLRQDKGKYWWELRSCAYWAEFDRPKIMYPEITWRAQWAFDRDRTVCNNTAYFLSSSDLWIVAVANSPVTWWYSWRNAVHGKDEALRFIKDYVSSMPIPRPSEDLRKRAEAIASRLVDLTESQSSLRHQILDWLRLECQIEKPSMKLQMATDLDSDSFVSEIKRARGKHAPLTVGEIRNIKDEYIRSIEPGRTQLSLIRQLERQLSDLVNEAYGLTADEVSLLWETAPPRMPFEVTNR
jgi:hypothetical protein